MTILKQKPIFAPIIIMMVMSTFMVSSRAADYYVAPDGLDSNPGSAERPFKTIAHAQAQVRKSPALGKQPVTVNLKGGTYSLGAPVVFTEEDSGTADAPATYKAVEAEEVIISGGVKLSLDWKPYKGEILQAETPAGLEIDQLFVNGECQHMARYPNYDPKILPYHGYAADVFSPKRAARWSDPSGGYMHAMHQMLWGGFHYRITGKTPDNNVTYEGGWQNNRHSGMHATYRFVENIFEELDAPGEWFHNRKRKTLYYYPPKGVDVKTATFEVARLKQLVEFQGTQAKPVRHIQLKGFTFRHTTRTFMETKEPLLRSDWTIYRGGAVLFAGAEDCLIADCELDQVGGNGIFVNNYNRRVTVRGTHIHGSGASAICFVGDPNAVRDPRFNYKDGRSYAHFDKTPGPKTDNYPADCVVEDCLIHNIGMVEKQTAGVEISMSKGITVRHCSIYDTPRAGINISEGTFGKHVIEFCDVFDTVRETSDHGSFNSWGRDRFWRLGGAPNEKLSELSGLDTETTIIRNSRWRCDRGFDVDLDDGSSHYEIYNNLFLHGGLKLREGFYRKAYNNIAVNNTLHPHAWYSGSMDVITNNIWMGGYRPAVMFLKGPWGKEIDRNFFAGESTRKNYGKDGRDENSAGGDPMFIDPAHGDYRVKEASPALTIGFKNFPMDQFGVQKPELKAIARTPSFAASTMVADLSKDRSSKNKSRSKSTWLGATVAALDGEEYSAFGVNKEDGGIHLVKVPGNSPAAKAGFKAGDVVQQINAKPVKTVTDLRRMTETSDGKPLKVTFVRDQGEMSLTIGSN